ncbi:MAG TPA: chromate transporter [Planctomycetota bacterium]|nr:chromate transporter [Planctomycetota bacterium]
MSLFWAFFRIGLFTLGGGFAMATVMRHELVLKRRWLSEDEFISAMSTATAVPGAIAVNLAFLQGRRVRGKCGATAATLGTICPSFFVILLIAWFALPYLENPRVAAFFKGCGIAVAGQIAFAGFTFARRLRRDWRNFAVCALGLLVVGLGLHPVWAIVAAAGLGFVLYLRSIPSDSAGNGNGHV